MENHPDDSKRAITYVWGADVDIIVGFEFLDQRTMTTLFRQGKNAGTVIGALRKEGNCQLTRCLFFWLLIFPLNQRS